MEAAAQTVRNIKGVDLRRCTAKVENNRIVEYRAVVKIAFMVERAKSYFFPFSDTPAGVNDPSLHILLAYDTLRAVRYHPCSRKLKYDYLFQEKRERYNHE